LGHRVDGLVGTDVKDADGVVHPGIIFMPIPILNAPREQITTIVQAAAEDNDLFFVSQDCPSNAVALCRNEKSATALPRAKWSTTAAGSKSRCERRSCRSDGPRSRLVPPALAETGSGRDLDQQYRRPERRL
jgi:hypothetical protein